MTRNVALPHKLYKFRPFEVHSLELLTDAKVHYSNPMKFNDPLDCRPTIELDVSRADLMRIAHSWLAPAEIDDLHTSGPDAEDIEGVEAWLKESLRDRLQAKLYSEFGAKTVLSMSASWKSPLMWSHYADQHQGICIEFDTQRFAHPNLEPVSYDSPRSVRASDLLRWKIHQCREAERRIYETYFFTKAPQWSYEHEWRDIIESHGAAETSFDITALYL
jgi:Protein of unknown function (DUF2971)